MAQKRLQEQLQRFEDNREDQELAQQKADEARTKADRTSQRCDQARKNLEVLSGPPRRLYQSPDGSVQRMDEEQRAKQRAEMEKIIAEDCK